MAGAGLGGVGCDMLAASAVEHEQVIAALGR